MQPRLATYASLVAFAITLLFIGALSLSAAITGWAPSRSLLLAGLLATGLAALRGVYRTRMVPDVTSMSARLAMSALAAALISLTISSRAFGLVFGARDLFVTAAGSWVALIAGLFAGTHTLKVIWRKGFGRSRAIVIGSGRLTNELLLELRHRPTYGVDVVGFAHLGPLAVSTVEAHDDISHVTIDGLTDLAVELDIDRLIIGPSSDGERELVRAARWAVSRRIPVFVVPRLFEMGVGLDSVSPDRLRGYPLVRVQRSAHPRIGLIAKRALDIAVSAGALAVLSPVMAVCAVAVRFSSPGPILFSQNRVGQYGRPIVVSKFRSMRESSDSDFEWTSDNRITTVGAFLRRTSLDELPQLYSILRGDMSLVGPRPERPVFVDEFAQRYENYNDRHRMRVGLTGLAQIVGLVGDTSIEERIKYDNLYIDQWSFGSDLQILIKTVWAVARQSSKKREQQELAVVLSNGAQLGEDPFVGPRRASAGA